MYYNTVDYNASQGPAARLGLMGYNGITNTGGALALSANFGVSPIAGDNDYTYFSNYNNQTLSGNSQGFLDVVAGDLADEFNTNGQFDLNGNAHDLFLKATFGRTLAAQYGWTVDATGDVQGAVPEPGSLALLGLGFAGLAGLRRRKAAK
ncbi:PEP-CTERM sorting domain-containing protein [Massilia sp. ML15P13]|uniref:PEP-CTERM sorting domain-containing protein n=2 Tax=Telluria aromaticivorans TaxID=2725995 RepID=A0A7Y2K164_9BURK|nr:PEP-CTERM sorting domain-containing protein [Telluria aromaticivorans]